MTIANIHYGPSAARRPSVTTRELVIATAAALIVFFGGV